uniref:HAD family hydrolase n=1 Tax=Lysinibacillus sp. D4A3_S15 TaxID=2941227 RepID=UPI0020C13187
VLGELAVDKTGTITQGKPVVTDFIVRDGFEPQMALAILAGIETQSNHPLAQAITSYAKAEGLTALPQATIEEIPGWGIKGIVHN